jgi:methionine synthase I (cobalamin-dependent)
MHRGLSMALMGTNLQVQNLSLMILVVCDRRLQRKTCWLRPDAVENVHSAFLEVGCDVIENHPF